MKVAILGYGTIGSGVAKVLKVNKDVLTKRAGEEVTLKYILDLREFPGDENEDKVVHDINVILEDDEVGVVVECMGGVEPACTFVTKALKSGKHVTTSNKALVAAKGSEVIQTAKDNNVNFMFEASVGGGIPIIRPLLQCLTGDVIEEISGIVNGTTNYMMTQMSVNGSEFDDVLKDAQAKGYAEADPTADIEGYDACRKIAILTSLVAGQFVDFEDIHTEGITKISATDIKYSKVLDRKIKLLASSYKVGDSYCAMVAPFLVEASNPLYSVEDVFNAVFVKGNMLGDSMFYGSGAGSLPTASAVVGDIVDMIRHKDENIPIEWKAEKLELVDYLTLSNKYFVRTSSTKNEVEAAFSNIEYVTADGVENEVAFVTEDLSGKDFEEAAAKIDVLNRIRVK